VEFRPSRSSNSRKFCIQLGDPLFVPVENDSNGRLYNRRDLVRRLLRDRQLRRHAAGVRRQLLSGKIGS
jgi:hypothetical protein